MKRTALLLAAAATVSAVAAAPSAAHANTDALGRALLGLAIESAVKGEAPNVTGVFGLTVGDSCANPGGISQGGGANAINLVTGVQSGSDNCYSVDQSGGAYNGIHFHQSEH